MKFIRKIPKLLRLIILFLIVLALLLIALFFVYLKIMGFTFEPTPNMISRIESTGRDATCADLIGTWSIRGDFKTWEFREDGTFVQDYSVLDEWDLIWSYTCDDSTRTAMIPLVDTAAPPNAPMCCATTLLGTISDDRMVIYMGYGHKLDPDAGPVYVIERK